MAPTTSVRSIRLPNTAWEWLAQEAARRKLTVNGLVAEWVAGEMAEDELGDAGPAFLLSPPSKGLYPPVPASQKPAKATAPEPEPKSHVALPVFERKPFNPQPKRGKK